MDEPTENKLCGVSTKAVVLDKEGRLLTLFRTETAPVRPNTWDLPGGDLDYGEEPEKGIVREVKEETGLDVTDVKIFDASARIDHEGVHWLTLAYKCLAINGNVKLSDEHNDYKWVTPEEFLKLESGPKLMRYVQAIKNSN
ncbi:MAG: hypothetical protein A3J48_00850 [Candidatus Doudnabacteria bacterium RIFCSPHIGHO2_02_FULL_46_11]|uniref:Nudix hydrolase domain-containing protein n=1 Tax=Candidatus Doudnabacteria bacterium RIFCSPHIGHO2_02_FULL_46_11 TaxID=1817832 RepID=A0A1F5P8C1_9BACT|nr:MAG: hypothetical protein A3J48_00850 [Candidatus Doudnabacteria bacterium RIFCSPHIGHO2_02_FULL_46_11]